MPNSARVNDYESLERQFVQGPLQQSVRELCRLNDITTMSPVHKFSREHEWVSKRAMWHGRVDDRTRALTADQEAARRAKAMRVHDKAFDVVESVFDRVIAGLQATHYVKEHDAEGEEIWVERPLITVTPGTAATLMVQLNALLGRPGTIEEHRGSIDINGAPPNILLAILERARGEAGAVSVGGSPIPRIEGPRQAE